MIDYIKRLFRWSKQPWPLHLLIIFIVIHLIGLVVFSANTDSWNQHSSAFLQLFGGWFVIKTINDNLGILSGSSIRQAIRDYLKLIPTYKPKPITLHVESGSFGVSFGNANLTINKKLNTTCRFKS